MEISKDELQSIIEAAVNAALARTQPVAQPRKLIAKSEEPKILEFLAEAYPTNQGYGTPKISAMGVEFTAPRIIPNTDPPTKVTQLRVIPVEALRNAMAEADARRSDAKSNARIIDGRGQKVG